MRPVTSFSFVRPDFSAENLVTSFFNKYSLIINIIEFLVKKIKSFVYLFIFREQPLAAEKVEFKATVRKECFPVEVTPQPSRFICPQDLFSYGKLSRQEAEDLLIQDPKGEVGLIRYSEAAKGAVFSYREKNNELYHANLREISLEKAIKNYNIKRLLRKDGAPIPLRRQYDQQIILNLGTGQTAAGLTAKAKNQILSCTIHLYNKEPELQRLAYLTPSSRLYLIGHSYSGGNYVESIEQAKQVKVNDYVKMLVDHAPHLQHSLSKQKLKISLIVCEAAQDDGINKSFAYQLSQALDQAGIPAEVIARTGDVSRWNGHLEDYKKFVNGEHKAEGSKLSFITENGKTVVQPVSYEPLLPLIKT